MDMKEPTVFDAIKWGLVCAVSLYTLLWLLEIGHAFIWGY